MSLHCVRYLEKEHIAHIVLNRPEAKNVVNQQLAHEVNDLCININQNKDVYVVIITGEGSVFCHGSELEQYLARNKDVTSSSDLDTIIKDFKVADSIAQIRKPVIAVINGDAIGQGLEIALSCDIRISSDKANFCLPQISYGFIPLDGGTQRLPRVIGRGNALELILTAKTINAKEAQTIGLVNMVVSGPSLISETEALAKEMTKKGPIAMRYVKEAVYRGMDLSLNEGLQLEADLYSLIQTTSDRYEGVKAFLKKRNPIFRGE